MRKVKEVQETAKPAAEQPAKAAKETKTVKKPARTRTTAPQVTEEVYVQFDGAEWSTAELTAKAKAAYEAEGHKASAMKKLCLYVKPQEHKAYYVVNDEISGSVEL